mmetsp:Transcript_35877/g.81192  ORF Transcript_35877/g.81192 Transcript_35877/m.81192 type:complete len:352 (+) Transcript_35877:121-1176(+)
MIELDSGSGSYLARSSSTCTERSNRAERQAARQGTGRPWTRSHPSPSSLATTIAAPMMAAHAAYSRAWPAVCRSEPPEALASLASAVGAAVAVATGFARAGLHFLVAAVMEDRSFGGRKSCAGLAATRNCCALAGASSCESEASRSRRRAAASKELRPESQDPAVRSGPRSSAAARGCARACHTAVRLWAAASWSSDARPAGESDLEASASQEDASAVTQARWSKPSVPSSSCQAAPPEAITACKAMARGSSSWRRPSAAPAPSVATAVSKALAQESRHSAALRPGPPPATAITAGPRGSAAETSQSLRRRRRWSRALSRPCSRHLAAMSVNTRSSRDSTSRGSCHWGRER